MENSKVDNGYLDDNSLDNDESLKRVLSINECDNYEDEEDSYGNEEEDDYLSPEYYDDEENEEMELGDCDESGCY